MMFEFIIVNMHVYVLSISLNDKLNNFRFNMIHMVFVIYLFYQWCQFYFICHSASSHFHLMCLKHILMFLLFITFSNIISSCF